MPKVAQAIREDLEEAVNNHGGKRPGAGRPKGDGEKPVYLYLGKFLEDWQVQTIKDNFSAQEIGEILYNAAVEEMQNKKPPK